MDPTSKHLLNVASLFQNVSSKGNVTVQCRLMHKLSCSDDKQSFKIKKNQFLKQCKWCLMTWRNGMNRVYIDPEKRVKKSLRYLCNSNSFRNKNQKKLVQKCKKNLYCNYLVVFCNICRKSSKMAIQKPNRIKKKGKKALVKNEPVVSVKKKKKKKDVFAGLNPAVFAKSRHEVKNNKFKRNNAFNSSMKYNKPRKTQFGINSRYARNNNTRKMNTLNSGMKFNNKLNHCPGHINKSQHLNKNARNGKRDNSMNLNHKQKSKSRNIYSGTELSRLDVKQLFAENKNVSTQYSTKQKNTNTTKDKSWKSFLTSSLVE